MEEFKVALVLPEREGLKKLVDDLSQIVAALLTGHLGYIAFSGEEARKNSLEAARDRLFNVVRSVVIAVIPVGLLLGLRSIQPLLDPQIMGWANLGVFGWCCLWLLSACAGKSPPQMLAVINQFTVTARSLVSGADISDKEK
ncbi:hypothetical protein GCM10023321_77630 [Pseudonocardia eucalypti]|uniref:Holin n=1 Tax=Pseudonocardia eucalypti TaxID=648755 RepID=A0ABP9RAV7_9PSEU|nr:hypothetical protein [Pseudonocardia eucalypti]